MPFLSLNQMHPNLIVVLVLGWCFLLERRESLIWAFVGGAWLDILASRPFGLFTLSLLLTALAASIWHDKSFGNPFLVPVVLTLPYTLLFNFFGLLALQVLGYPVAWGNTLLYLMFPAALVNMLAMSFVFPLLSRVYQRGRQGQLHI